MNTYALEQARLLFLEGIEHFQAQDFVAAQTKFSRALEFAPDRPSLLLNLGVTQVSLGRHAEAIPLLEKSLAAEPDSADGWTALAVARFERHEWLDAAAAFEEAFRRGADQQIMRLQYAQCLVRIGLRGPATAVYQGVLAQDPRSIEACYELGELHRADGRISEAIGSYRQALALGADPELISFVLSALGDGPAVAHPPARYVQGLFDHYSAEFDDHLVGQLQYQAHRVLAELLPMAEPSRFARVLDLGCGTGLCGAELRARADWLAGIDVSAAMLERARQRGVFDELTQGDIVAFLRDSPQSWDLIIASDVLNYVGELQPLFEQLANRIRPNGWFAFTTELPTRDQSVSLDISLRYSHGPHYVAELANRYGFVVDGHWQAPLRSEAGQPLMGEYWRLQRKP